MSAANRPLVFAWALLIGLSMAMAVVADVGHASRLGRIGIVAIAAVSIWKARLILGVYLGLARVPSALAGFTAAVAVIMTVVTFIFVIVPSP